jgi:hypothetical protein
MDEGKKPEASGEELEKLGPDPLQEQVPQSDDSQGECYLAPYETSRAAALVRKRAMWRMAHAGSDIREPRPRPRWRLGLGLASAAAVCALFFALVHLTSGSPPPSGAEPLAYTPAVLASDDAQESAGTPDAPFASGALVDTSDAGDSVLARPLPREPFKGQKRPPCTRYAEVELIGACWTPHEIKAPCPDVLYEHQGKCYVPNFSAKPPPQSLGQ